MRKVGLSRFADVSMYKRAVSALFAALLALSVVSCGIGLEPARSEGAVVSLSVTTIPGYESGRAVAPVSSFLYIRMLGGPDGTGAKGYYGPYSLSIQTPGGALFTTKDIPAGDYSGMAVLMSESKIDEKQVTVDEKPMTMAQVFALPDADFRAAVTTKDLTSGFTLLDTALNNLGSYGITNALTIRANQVNPVSVTLRPATTVSTSATEKVSLYNETDPFRSFARLAGLTFVGPTTIPEGQTAMVKVTVQNTGATPINLRALAFYTEAGALIPGSTLVSKSVAANSPPSVTFPWDGKDSCFFYAETEGIGLSLSFDITLIQAPPTGGFPVTVTNIPSQYNGWDVSLIVSPVQLTATDLQDEMAIDMMMQMGWAEGYVSGTIFTSTCFGYSENMLPWTPLSGKTYHVYVILDSETETESAILMAPGTQTGGFKPLYSSELNAAGLTINAAKAVIIDGSTPTPVFEPITVTINNLNTNMGTVELLVFNTQLAEEDIETAETVYSYTLPTLNAVEVVKLQYENGAPWVPDGSATPYYIYLSMNGQMFFASTSVIGNLQPINGGPLFSGQQISIDATQLTSFTEIHYVNVSGSFNVDGGEFMGAFDSNSFLRVDIQRMTNPMTLEMEKVGESISINRLARTWQGRLRRDAGDTLYYAVVGETEGAASGMQSGENSVSEIYDGMTIDIIPAKATYDPFMVPIVIVRSEITLDMLSEQIDYVITDADFTPILSATAVVQYGDMLGTTGPYVVSTLLDVNGKPWVPGQDIEYFVRVSYQGTQLFESSFYKDLDQMMVGISN